MKSNSAWPTALSNLPLLLSLVLLCAVAIAAHATTITVTNTNDSGPGSLRQALADANDGDTIEFAVTGTIGLTSGELLVDKNVIISGPGAVSLAVSGNSTSRVFHIGAGKTVSISGLTIRNGGVDLSGNGLLNDHAELTMDSCVVRNNFGASYGGGIYNDGNGFSGDRATLIILNSAITFNHADFAGGGIYNDASFDGEATLTITNSKISNNAAEISDEAGISDGDGGGIYNSDGTVTLTNSSVSDNFAGSDEPFPAGFGGGIFNAGMLTITGSTINNNECVLAGGGIEDLSNKGTLTITNGTVSGNRAYSNHDGNPGGRGGGISGGPITLINTTVSDNHANLAYGGIIGGGTIANTILNNNSDANITGTFTSLGYNMSSDDGGGILTGPGDQINTDPMLGPLQGNGGPTLTHALLPGSPAIDAGDPNFTPPPWYDQRGPNFYRLRNDRIDIGSFEVQEGPALTPTPTPTPSPTVTPTPTFTPTPSPRPTPTPRSRPTPLPRPTPR